MGALQFDALLRTVHKGAPDPVYYLHGDEDVLKDEAIDAISRAVLDPSTRDFNLDVPDPAGLDPDRLQALVDTPPMLASRRLVIVRGVEQLRKKSRAREALLRYCANPNPTTVLVLVQPAGDPPAEDLAITSTAVACERLPAERAARWVAHRARQHELTLEPDAVRHLLAATRQELGAAAQEIEKLAVAVRGRPATAADVAALVGVRVGATVPDFVAAALEHRATAAAGLVAPVLEQAGVTGVRVLMALGTALVGTALARAVLDRGDAPGRAEGVVFTHIRAARPYGLGSWREEAARWVRWAQGWRAADLRHALRLALEADRALKTGGMTDDAGILQQLVLSWSVPVQEAA